MDTSMLIYPLLVFVIGFAAMIYMKTKGRNTKGNYKEVLPKSRCSAI